MFWRIAVIASLAAVASSCAGCSDPSAFETPEAVFDPQPAGLEFTAVADLDEDDRAALGLMSVSLDSSEDSVLGRLDLAPEDVDDCAFAIAASFVPIPDEVDDLDSLTAAAAEWSGKEVEEFEATDGLDGRLRRGSEDGCAEAVLAVDLDDVYVFALGHPDVLDAFVAHLRD